MFAAMLAAVLQESALTAKGVGRGGDGVIRADK